MKIKKSLISKPISSIKDTVNNTANSIAYSADSAYSSIATSIEDKYEGAKSISKGIIGAASSTLFVGLISIGFTASLPVSAGIALLSFICFFLGEEADIQTKDYNEKKSKRIIDNASSFISKYGKLPEIGVVETDLLSMSLNSKNLEANGVIKQGTYKGKNLSELTIDEVKKLKEFSDDESTSKLLSSYIQYRENKEKN